MAEDTNGGRVVTEDEKKKKRGEAFLIAMLGTLFRDAQMMGDGTTLGQRKPISMKERIRAAREAVDLICPELKTDKDEGIKS